MNSLAIRPVVSSAAPSSVPWPPAPLVPSGRNDIRVPSYSPAEAVRALDIVTKSIYRDIMTIAGRDNRWKMRFVTEFLSHLTDEMRTSRTDGPKPLEDEHSGVELNVVLLITEMRSQGFGFDHIAQVATGLISCMATDWPQK